MATVLGEGPFADAVRRALEYVQSRGVDLSGVVVEVVPDPSITGAGAYTENLGGLRFRIRYDPRYAGDSVLAAHEAGHVAYWTWQNKKSGRVQYVPDIDELLAEALGAVTARQLYGVPVTFKGAPLNLTQILPQRTSYITVTVDGKPITVKLPEWGDYVSRYKAGEFVAPYFYNMTNWSHVFGNFTAAPADIIDTVHKAWKEGAVEVVPGWGPVWRTTPTWSWPSDNKTTDNNSTQQNPSITLSTNTSTTAPLGGDNTTQKNDATTSHTTPSHVDVQKAVVYAQPSADVPLPPSNVQPPRYFSSDIVPKYVAVPEWDSYISGRRVLVVFRNWPSLDTTTLTETRKDHVAGVGIITEGKLRFEDRIPVPRVVDSNAWIELVDEKTGKVLARLRSDELYKLTSEGAPVALYWSHVAAEEKWPGWERFVDRAKELDEKLGTWKPGTAGATPPGARGAASINPDGTIKTVGVANAPTEYVPPKLPDDVRRQFENLLSELKKLGEGVNLKNVDEVHDKFMQLRDKALDIARAFPQLIDEANQVIGRVGSAISKNQRMLEEALAKAAGRDSFWRGDGDVKNPIGVYKYDPATGAFLLSLYDKPTAENIVGFIKDDGTPVVVKKTQNMSEALDEYNKLLQKPQTAGGFIPPPVPTAQLQTQSTSADFLQPLRGAVDFLTNAVKTGAGVVLTALGGGKPSPTKQAGDSQEFVQPPSGQQKTNEFVVVRPSRAPDYVLAEEETRRSVSTYNTALDAAVQTSSGYRPADYVVGQQSSGSSSTPSASPPAQLTEASQTQESSSSKRYRGRLVAVAI